jgi:hypothetical protein
MSFSEIGIRVDRTVLGGQIADMPEGGQDLIILAEIFIDRLGLRRRLDDDDFHERLPKVAVSGCSVVSRQKAAVTWGQPWGGISG